MCVRIAQIKSIKHHGKLGLWLKCLMAHQLSLWKGVEVKESGDMPYKDTKQTMEIMFDWNKNNLEVTHTRTVAHQIPPSTKSVIDRK